VSGAAGGPRSREAILGAPIQRTLLRLAWPAMATTLLGEFQTFISMFWIGRLIGELGLATLGVVAPVFTTLGLIAGATHIGVQVLAARSTGSADGRALPIVVNGSPRSSDVEPPWRHASTSDRHRRGASTRPPRARQRWGPRRPAAVPLHRAALRGAPPRSDHHRPREVCGIPQPEQRRAHLRSGLHPEPEHGVRSPRSPHGRVFASRSDGEITERYPSSRGRVRRPDRRQSPRRGA